MDSITVLQAVLASTPTEKLDFSGWKLAEGAKISLLVDEIASLRGALITKEKIIQQLISQQAEREAAETEFKKLSAVQEELSMSKHKVKTLSHKLKQINNYQTEYPQLTKAPHSPQKPKVCEKCSSRALSKTALTQTCDYIVGEEIKHLRGKLQRQRKEINLLQQRNAKLKTNGPKANSDEIKSTAEDQHTSEQQKNCPLYISKLRGAAKKFFGKDSYSADTTMEEIIDWMVDLQTNTSNMLKQCWDQLRTVLDTLAEYNREFKAIMKKVGTNNVSLTIPGENVNSWWNVIKSLYDALSLSQRLFMYQK